jgi:hypothetical protein
MTCMRLKYMHLLKLHNVHTDVILFMLNWIKIIRI